jgi:hypothetical protein
LEKEMRIQFLDTIRVVFCRTLSNYLNRKGLTHPLTFSEFTNCLTNQVLISNEQEAWSLFSIGNIDFRFNLKIQREWDFSCRSFQIDLQTAVAHCLFGNFEEAIEDAKLKRLRTIFPEGIYKGLERCLVKLEQGFTCGSKEIYRGLLSRYFTTDKGTEGCLESLIDRFLLFSTQNISDPKEKERRESLATEEMLTLLSVLERPSPYLSLLTSKILAYIQNPLSLLHNIPDILSFCKNHPQIYFSVLTALTKTQRCEYITSHLLPIFFRSKEMQPILYPICKEALSPFIVKEWLEESLSNWNLSTMIAFYEEHLSTLPKKKVTLLIDHLLLQETISSEIEALVNHLISLGKERFPNAQEHQRLLLSWSKIVIHTPILLDSKHVLSTIFLHDTSNEKKWVIEKVKMLLALQTKSSQELFIYVLQKGYFGFLPEEQRLHFIQEITKPFPSFYFEKIDILFAWYQKEGCKLPPNYPLLSIREQAIDALLQKGDFSNLIFFFQKPSPLLAQELRDELLLNILEKAKDLGHPLTEEFVLSLLKITVINKDNFEKKWLSIFYHFVSVYPKNLSLFFLESETLNPPFSSQLQTIKPFELYQVLHQKFLEIHEEGKAFEILIKAKELAIFPQEQLDIFLSIWEEKRKGNSKSPYSLMKQELALFYPTLFEKTDILPYMTQYLTFSYTGTHLKWMEEVDRYIPANHPLRKKILLSSLIELFRSKKIHGSDSLPILAELLEGSERKIDDPQELSLWSNLLSLMEPQESFLSLSSFWWKCIHTFPEEQRAPFLMQYGEMLGKLLRYHAQTSALDKKLSEIEAQFPTLFSSNKKIAFDLYLWAIGRQNWLIAFQVSKKLGEIPVSLQRILLERTIEALFISKNIIGKDQELIYGILGAFYPLILQNKEQFQNFYKIAQDWLEKKPSSLALLTYLFLAYPLFIQKAELPIQEKAIRNKIIEGIAKLQKQRGFPFLALSKFL